MFIERLKENFKIDEPIFTEEILRLFSDYSRAQVFRYIKNAVSSNEIIKYSDGVYFIPKKTWLGLSTITASDVVWKKYISNSDEVFGIFSGVKLLNNFLMTTQLAATIEIVSNNESAKYKEIQIGKRKFIIRRSRFKINSENEGAYTVLQLFTEFDKRDKLNPYAKQRLLDYISEMNVTKDQLCSLAVKFPPATSQNLLGSGILNEIV